jgi:hypothetical protein
MLSAGWAALEQDDGNSMNIKRMRGRNNRSNGGGGGGGNFRSYQSGTPLNRNHVFDSSGPEQRVRGTAQQLYDKYQQMGRDATSGGDRVLAEAYYQHAEHYFRIITVMNQAQGNNQGGQQNNPNGQSNGRRDDHQRDDNYRNENRGDESRGDDNRGDDNRSDGEYQDQANGLGDQPQVESRAIPINAAPPEG